jgi:hypothetical protein
MTSTPFERLADFCRRGWAARWRDHPPFWSWLGYYLRGRRLPGTVMPAR